MFRSDTVSTCMMLIGYQLKHEIAGMTQRNAGERDCTSHYRSTALIRNNHSLGPYSRPIPKALRWS